MDSTDFGRLVARASDSRLISGIYNYCDGRCPRCPMTDRCLTFLDNEELRSAERRESTSDTVDVSLRRTLEVITDAARREGLAEALRGSGRNSGRDAFERHRRDALAVRAREYGHLAWPISRAIAPIVAMRGDAAVIAAVETIEWFSSMISSKIYRAICGQAEGWEPADGVQTDFNGSAKVALLGIEESRQGWTVLMWAGKATANGVPAQAVKMLAELDAAVRERFPRAMKFVRPGFDEPERSGEREV